MDNVTNKLMLSSLHLYLSEQGSSTPIVFSDVNESLNLSMIIEMSQLQWVVDEYDPNVRQEHLQLLDLVELTATVHVFNNTFIYSGLYSDPNIREIALRITYIPLRFNTNLSSNARKVISALIQEYFRVSSVTIVSSGKVLLDSGIELFLPRSDINTFMEEVSPLRYSRGHILVGWNIPPEDDMIQVMGWTILIVNPRDELTAEVITRQENFEMLERMSNSSDDTITPYSFNQYQVHSEYLGHEFTVIDSSCILRDKDPLDARVTYFLIKFLLRDTGANVIYSNQFTRNSISRSRQSLGLSSRQSIDMSSRQSFGLSSRQSFGLSSRQSFGLSSRQSLDLNLLTDQVVTDQPLQVDDSNTYFIITWPVDSDPSDIRLKYISSAKEINSDIPDSINTTLEGTLRTLAQDFAYNLIERLTPESAWGGRVNASDNGVKVWSILYNDVWYNIVLPPYEDYFDTVNPREQAIDPGVDVTFLEVGDLSVSE